jgi:hypothetical protein
MDRRTDSYCILGRTDGQTHTAWFEGQTDRLILHGLKDRQTDSYCMLGWTDRQTHTACLDGQTDRLILHGYTFFCFVVFFVCLFYFVMFGVRKICKLKLAAVNRPYLGYGCHILIDGMLRLRQ